jgi:cell division protein FtsA
MNNSDQQHFVGLDIGTANVRCVVATSDEQSGKPSIIGYGSAPNVGMRRGVVVHAEDVTEAIIAAITAAERLSGVRVNQATVNINGTHVLGNNSKGVIAISGVNRPITDEDRARVEDAATVVKLPPNREIVQVFAKNYALDGQGNIKDPVGMTGVRLEVDTHLVTAATPNLKSLNLALDKAQVAVNRYTVAGLAAAEAVMSRQQKESGTALVDIGAGTTNIAVLEEGEVQHVAILPIGGTHLTNDLAIGLKTDLDVAEQVKLKHASLNGPEKKQIKIKLAGQEHTFSSEDVAMITEARMEELFEYINKELSKIHRANKLPGGIVLAGGGSKIAGLAEFAREQLGLPARLGRLQSIGGLTEQVDDPKYFTAVGLTLLDMLLPGVEPGGFSLLGDRFSGLFDSFKNRFK